MTSVLIKLEDMRNIQRQSLSEDGGKVWSDAAACQRMPAITENNQKLGRDKAGFFTRAFRGSMALLTH